MSKELKIGIVFTDHKTWTGGNYYLSNLLRSLSDYQGRISFSLVLFCNAEDYHRAITLANDCGVKVFVVNRKTVFLERVLNKVYRLFGLREPYPILPDSRHADVVFPNAPKFIYGKIANRMFWIPDFQEWHLPEFFTPEEIAARRKMQQNIADQNATLVLSSRDSLKDFRNFFPDARAHADVVHFAVIHPPYNKLSISDLRSKYDLPDKYFIAPNQFWAHKNHLTVIKAVELSREQGDTFTVVFTGNEDDYRNPGYTANLKKYAEQNDLMDFVRFLGFIDRKEQLQLMNHAVAVIQPSAFEGWSTVIEDAKAMGQSILASSLEVHKEQLENYKGESRLFETGNHSELYDSMREFTDRGFERNSTDYSDSVKKFGEDFLQVAVKTAERK